MSDITQEYRVIVGVFYRPLLMLRSPGIPYIRIAIRFRMGTRHLTKESSILLLVYFLDFFLRGIIPIRQAYDLSIILCCFSGQKLI